MSLRAGVQKVIFAPLIRDQAGRLAFGETILDGARTYLGSPLGPMRGRDGNVHRGGRGKELPMISHLGAMISVTVGALFARRFKGETDTVGVTPSAKARFDRRVSRSIEPGRRRKTSPRPRRANNQYAYSTPIDASLRANSSIAPGLRRRRLSLDGTDLTACLEVMGGAVTAREQAVRPMVVARAAPLRSRRTRRRQIHDPKIKRQPRA